VKSFIVLSLPHFFCLFTCCFVFQLLQIIERSLPKKQKVTKDAALIEKEEMEKLGKIWVNIVRRDLPRHHRNFTTFHRKQVVDAKRAADICQREACPVSPFNRLFLYISNWFVVFLI